jgi:hypothetical protein
MQHDNQRAFIDELNQLRRRAGHPSLERLVTLSRRRGGRVQLARSTISDVLNFKRLGLPEWGWVKALVLACGDAAAEDDVDLGELGEVPYWYARYCRVELGVISHRYPSYRPEQAGSEIDPEKRRRYVGFYGRTGGRLLRRASEGDLDAAYQLGVLLHCDRHHDEAREWLHRAARAEHFLARALYRHPRPRDVVDGAPQAACDIGRSAVRAGKPSVAMVFFTRAALAGHAEAAECLADLYADRGTTSDAREAANWRDWARRCRTTPIDKMTPASWMRPPPDENGW